MQYLNIFWRFVFTIFAFIYISTSSCMAQDTKETDLDFNTCFEVLRNNRIKYNQYNDSILLIKNHAQWVNFFYRRAIVNHRIYDANKVVLDYMERYFQNEADSIADNVYFDFFNKLNNEYMLNAKSDPFITYSLCNMLQKASRNMPDSIKPTNIIHLWRLYSYVQMWNLGGDTEYLRRAYKHGMAILSDEAGKYPYRDFAIGNAMQFMCKTWWIILGLQTIDEYRQCCQRLGDFLRRGDLTHILPAERIATLKRIQQMADEALVRNTYLVDSTKMERQEALRLMRKIVDRNAVGGNDMPLSQVRTTYMRVVLGDISATQARKEVLGRYKNVWKRTRDKRLQPGQLSDFLQPFYTLLYINHMADISLAEKKKTVRQICHHIEQAYRNRIDQQSSTEFVRDLERLSTDPFLVQYLDYKQYMHFLYSLVVATQTTTYAHSVHVAKISEVLTKCIMKHRPGMLRGLLGCNTTVEVLANKRKFYRFVYNASMLHDLGKNSIVSVVNDDYRPLTQQELKFVKRHPELGAKYLNIYPELSKYADIALGHHKWYNGMGGYPDSFDNTKSPIRLLIDIVTLSDCIQAATEKIGRNYRYEKSIDVVMDELRHGAGTIYNPDLVSLIDRYPKTRKKLEYLIADGWVEIYYNIYKNYLKL